MSSRFSIELRTLAKFIEETRSPFITTTAGLPPAIRKYKINNWGR